MQTNGANYASHLRRTNFDSQQLDTTTSNAPAAAIPPEVLRNHSELSSNGHLLRHLGDKARDEWQMRIRLSTTEEHDVSVAGSSLPNHITALEQAAEDALNARAAELFADVDTENPTLEMNEARFNVSSSQGPDESAYIDFGNGTEVFVFNDERTGNKHVFRVEDGELGDRISDEGTVNLGNGIYLRNSDSDIRFQQGPTSVFNLRPPTLQLNSDNTMVTIKNRQGSNFFDYLRSPEVNAYDIRSGNQIVDDGVANTDKMSLQQQFDYYAGTRQGRQILTVEGDHYSRDAEKRLFVARVQFLRNEGGPELFNDFTPRRASLSGDDLADYDAAVQEMMAEIRGQGVYTTGGEEIEQSIDESMLYIVASGAVEAYGESPEAMEAIMADLGKWLISTDNADGIEIVTDTRTSFSAGWYNGGSGTVQFSVDWLIYDYIRPDDEFELVTHELAHSLDNVDGETAGFLDGIPPGLSDDEIDIFIAERERLFELAYPGLDVDSSINQDFNSVADNSGFRNYTFFNRKEFWAELTATFLGSDAGAEIVRNASPELYDMLRVYYGREDLPASEPPKSEMDWTSIFGPLKDMGTGMEVPAGAN